jgi:hypothetical protein
MDVGIDNARPDPGSRTAEHIEVIGQFDIGDPADASDQPVIADEHDSFVVRRRANAGPDAAANRHAAGVRLSQRTSGKLVSARYPGLAGP